MTTLLQPPFIFIYGPPGSGKTTTARKLGKALALPWLDLDTEIERQNGQTIGDIFTERGEGGFRQLEKAALQQALTGQGVVIALGGGTLLDEDNRQAVETAGRVICLEATPEMLLRRTRKQAGQRPLLGSADEADDRMRQRLTALLTQRQAHYASFPIRFDSSKTAPARLAWQIQVHLGRFHLRGMGSSRQAGYPVLVQSGGLVKLGAHMQQAGLRGTLALVTDTNVATYYGDTVLRALQMAGYHTSMITFPAGETHKTQSTVSHLWQSFMEAGLDRRSTIVALGGGVTSDLAGFAAATYMRGIDWVAVPTTLLAMADAAVGGKIGFDFAGGKNLVGAFYPPRMVLADPQTLETLPQHELRAGMAEVVKAGLVGDPRLFEMCSQGWAVVEAHIEEIVRSAMAVKIRIVQADPYERGRRAALNLGHTIGHAVESASDYRLLHGEAVAIGLVQEARLAERIGLSQGKLVERIATCLSGLGLPTEIPPEFSADAIIKAAVVDKKRLSGSLLFSLPIRIGRVRVGVSIPDWDQYFKDR